MSNSIENEEQDDTLSPPIDPENWVDHYGDSMYRYAITKLRDPTIAEEVVQDTFLAGLKAREKFKRQSSVSTWLFAILRHKIADRYRERKSINLDPERPVDTVESSGNQPQPTQASSRGKSWNDDPATIFENREFWDVFNECVDKLPDKLAEVHLLREINQHSAKEVCKILGISPTNLSMRLHRCRLALRDCLQKRWFTSDQKT